MTSEGVINLDSELFREVCEFVKKNRLGLDTAEAFVEAAIRRYLLLSVARQNKSLRTRIFEEDALLPR